MNSHVRRLLLCPISHHRTTKRHTQVSHAIFPLASISKKSTIIDLIFDLVSRTTPQGELGNHIVVTKQQCGCNQILNLRRFTDSKI